MIALPHVDRLAARDVLDRARLALLEACARVETVSVAASFGVADTTQSDRLDALLRAADDALSIAKSTGRDRVVLAGPPHHEVPESEMATSAVPSDPGLAGATTA